MPNYWVATQVDLQCQIAIWVRFVRSNSDRKVAFDAYSVAVHLGHYRSNNRTSFCCAAHASGMSTPPKSRTVHRSIEQLDLHWHHHRWPPRWSSTYHWSSSLCRKLQIHHPAMCNAFSNLFRTQWCCPVSRTVHAIYRITTNLFSVIFVLHNPHANRPASAKCHRAFTVFLFALRGH